MNRKRLTLTNLPRRHDVAQVATFAAISAASDATRGATDDTSYRTTDDTSYRTTDAATYRATQRATNVATSWAAAGVAHIVALSLERYSNDE